MTRWLLALFLLTSSLANAGPLALIADLNGRYGSVDYHSRVSEAVAAIIALEPEAVVIAGDMIAGQANPPLTGPQLTEMWASFDRLIYEPLHRHGIQVLAVPGNHDASVYPAYSHERRAYANYWNSRVPGQLLGDSRFPWYYAVELEAGILVGLDVTAPEPLSPEQEEFLAHHRKAAVASKKTLLVVTHLPKYPVANGREREVFTSTTDPSHGEVWIAGHHHAFYLGVTPGGGLQLSLPPLGGNLRTWLGGNRQGPFGFVSFAPGSLVALHAWPGFDSLTPQDGPESIGALHRAP